MALLLLSLLLQTGLSAASVPIPLTIGNGVLTGARNSTFEPVVVLEHTLLDSSAYGVMTHWWSTGEQINDQVVLDYWIDGESSPSVSFQLGMAAGQGWPRMHGNLGGDGLYDPPPAGYENFSPWGIYSAGGKMGKHGQAGAYMGYHNILFQKSIKVTARTIDGYQVIYLVVRGHEVPKSSPSAAGHVLPSEFRVPPNARMQLQRIDNVEFKRLEFVPLVDLPKGYAGLIHLVTLAPMTSPAGNSYIEGCWHLFTDSTKQWPGIIMGTGTEDFFDSSYYWCALGGNEACLHAHDNTGLVHFSRTWPNGTSAMGYNHGKRPYPEGTIERFSAYRFFDNEVVGFRDGGALHWRVGDAGGKCLACPTGKDPSGNPCGAAYGEPNPVTVKSYAWMYTWPLDESQGPAPSQEPIQCPDPAVCGPHFPNPHALESPTPDAAELEAHMTLLKQFGPRGPPAALPSMQPQAYKV